MENKEGNDVGRKIGVAVKVEIRPRRKKGK